jgi:hypothetical protein
MNTESWNSSGLAKYYMAFPKIKQYSKYENQRRILSHFIITQIHVYTT